MRQLSLWLVYLMVAALVGGCSQQQGPSTTKGTAVVECDESVYSVLQLAANDFHSAYPEASVTLRPVEVRVAIDDFVNDTVLVIVCGREFNNEERAAVAAAKHDLKEFKVALDAIAVIGNMDNPLKKLRIGELDSIFTGTQTRWGGSPRGDVIEVAIGGPNSSVNEVFQSKTLKGSPFTVTAMGFDSSARLVDFVRTRRNAIGIVGLSWVKGKEDQLTVFALGDPAVRADSTEPIGKYYSPAQAYIYKGYYPITRPVYVYSRDVRRNVGLGFIAYLASAQGQKMFLNNGLVPATMPVRIVELTSQQVNPQ